MIGAYTQRDRKQAALILRIAHGQLSQGTLTTQLMTRWISTEPIDPK